MKKICFEILNVQVSYLEKEILKIDRLALHQLDRIGIVGKNGVGKSTLINLLANKVQPSQGKVNRHVDFGYFKQVEAPDTTEADPKLLGKLHVPQQKDGLSGGEQTRLKLAQLFTKLQVKEKVLLDDVSFHQLIS